LSEIVDADNQGGVAQRTAQLIVLAETLRERFFLTQDIGDQLAIERHRSINSIPRIPPDILAGLLDSFRSSEEFFRLLPEIRRAIKSQQRKEDNHQHNVVAGKEMRPLFKRHHNNLPAVIEAIRHDDSYWRSVFVSNVSKDGRYRERIRSHPRRYSTAAMAAGYHLLNVFQAIFEHTAYGRFAQTGVLKAPHRNDGVDLLIAACSAYARVFLTEDSGQLNKVNLISRLFGLCVRAYSTEGWINHG